MSTLTRTSTRHNGNGALGHAALPPSHISVDLDAIAHNTRALKAHVGPGVAIMGVVKANGYGHGMIEVARTILAHGADWLAVGGLTEGAQLRAAGITAPVLALGYVSPPEIPALVAQGITPSLTEPDVALALAEQARLHGRTIPVHVKVDTGMGRYGLLPDDLLPFLNWLRELPGLTLEGLFTHFSTADSSDKSYSRQQMAQFTALLSAVEAAGHRVAIRHAANSAATLDLPETHLDLVRPGLALYGMYPSPEVGRDVPLRPALTFRSLLARAQSVPAGTPIGYGQTFVTPQAMTVGLVPVGYGDGLHRALSNRGAALIRGRRAPIIGRVCMDQFMVDLSAIPEAQVNDPVVILGAQAHGPHHDAITAEELAGWAGTISYEALAHLLPRTPRFYTPAV